MIEHGLSFSEVDRIRNKFGFNEIHAQKMVSRWTVIKRQLKSPLLGFLFIANALALWLGNIPEAIAILAIILLNIGIGYFQEWKAEKAIVSLRKIVPQVSKAIREGQLYNIPAKELVPGDLVKLEAGDRVPADGLIVTSANVAIDESILTGESFPIDNPKSVKAGTFIVRGTLTFKIEAIGNQTEFGKTAGLLSKSSLEETPLQKRLSQLSKQIVLFCGVIVLLVVGLSLYQGRNIWEVLLFGISLLVASVPEGLPVMVSLGLALGVMRMARRKVLVRHLTAVETLGNVTIVCTDKTGTLTLGQLELTDIVSENISDCLLSSISCAEASVKAEIGVGDSLEQAVARRAFKDLNLHREDIEKSNPRIDVIPFDSETRSMKITRKDSWVYWKGAPEVLIASLKSEEQEKWRKENHQWTSQGYRTLAVAKISPEKQIVFNGLLVFSDPPRPEAKSSVAAAHTAGIQTLMLTGDHELTAAAIAKQMNIEKYLSRVKAGDKLAKVRELKKQGHIVAMTGDGVNDAPALKEADVGVSMGLRGSEVAREASDIVLLDDNYASLVVAIQEGRGIFNNIRRSVTYLLVGNWAELILIVLSSLVGLPLPLVASQLLWINLFTDGFPALALMLEPADENLLKLPPRPIKEALLRQSEWLKIIFIGSLEGLVVFFVFKNALAQNGLAVAQTQAFLVLVWSQVLRLLVFADSLVFWKGPSRISSRWIISCVVLSILIQSLFVFLPWLRTLLSLSELSLQNWEEVYLDAFIVPVSLVLWKGLMKLRQRKVTK